MANEILKIGDRVRSNRNNLTKNVLENDTGTVVEINNIQSEIYLDVQLDKGNYVGLSSENYWEKITE